MSRSRIIAGKAVIVIEAVDRMDKTLGKIRTNLHKFANAASAAGDQLFRTGFFGSIASGVMLRQFAKFDDLMLELQVSLNKLNPTARQTDKSLMSLEKRIRMLGRETSFTTQEVTQAAIRLAKAGIKESDIEKMLSSILDLARGTNTDLETASNVFVRAISAFTDSGKEFNAAISESQKIVSQFVLATRSGVLDLTDLEAGLRYVQGTASSLNQTLAGTLAVLTELSNKGLVGSIGGTSYNTMLQNLAKKAGDLRAMGINVVTDSNGDLSLLPTMQNLFNKFKGLGSLERTSIMGQIFNLRGNRAAQAAAAIDKIDMLTQKLKGASDEAARSSKIMDSGWGGAIRRLISSLDDLSISMGQAIDNFLIPFTEGIRAAANAMNALSQANPSAAAWIIASPAILVASGIGFMALSKALRLAAISAGMFKSAYSKVGSYVSKSVGSKMIMGSRMLQTPGPTGKIAGVGRGITSGLYHAGRGATYEQRFINIARKQLRYEALLTQRQRQRAQLARLIQARAGTQAAAPYFASAARLGRGAARAGTSARLARGAAGTARASALGALGSAAKNVAFGFRNIGKTALFMGNVLRRVFSLGGLTTTLELLLLFGNKVPMVASAMSKFGQAFGAAFKAIGNIGTFGKGPLEVFRASFEAFTAGKGKLGLQGLVKGFSLLASVIQNQLVAAWNRFKEALGPVYDFLRNTIMSIVILIEGIVNSIGNILGAVTGVAGNALNTLTGGFFSDGGGGFSSAVQTFSTATLKLVSGLLYWVDVAAAKLEQSFNKFINALRIALVEYNPFMLSSSKTALLNELNTYGAGYDATAQRKERQALADDATRRLAIDQTFARNAAKEGAAGAAAAAGRSGAASQMGYAIASSMRGLLKQLQQTTPTPGGGGNPLLPQQQQQQMQQAVRQMLPFVSSLVGSSQSTRRNILKFGKDVEQKQLDTLESIDDGIKAIGKNQGVLFAN
jgi:TP901 family phage tail tape measure protein